VIKKDINEIIKWYYTLKKDWPTDVIQRMIFKYKLYEASFLSQVLAMIEKIVENDFIQRMIFE
jgi:hypothetical protein